jgi:tetratricopeptide (TPR) repeat protein
LYLYKSVLIIAVLFFIHCKNDKKTTPQLLAEKATAYPDSLPIQYAYINALDSNKNYKLAIEKINSLLLKDKGNADLWFKKGELLQKNFDTTAAIQAYNKAASIYPAPQILLSLANLYAETKNPLTLIICQEIKKLSLGKEYEGYAAFFNAVYLSRLNKYEEALALFNTSIALNYTLMDAYMEKGFLLFDAKKYNEALDVFTLATTINHTYADGFYWKAKCYEILNKKQEAIDNYQTALNLNSTIVEAKIALQRLQ